MAKWLANTVEFIRDAFLENTKINIYRLLSQYLLFQPLAISSSVGFVSSNRYDMTFFRGYERIYYILFIFLPPSPLTCSRAAIVSNKYHLDQGWCIHWQYMIWPHHTDAYMIIFDISMLSIHPTEFGICGISLRPFYMKSNCFVYRLLSRSPLRVASLLAPYHWRGYSGWPDRNIIEKYWMRNE